MAEDYGRSAAGDEDWGRRSIGDCSRSAERGCGVQHEHRDGAIDGWREDVDQFARRAGRRRLPEHLDQSARSEDIAGGERSGSDHQHEWRRELELVVQPADGAALSRSCDEYFSLPGMRGAAGERVRLHVDPRERWGDYVSRVAPRGDYRVWICGARSAASGDCLWRGQDRGVALQQRDGRGAERYTAAVEEERFSRRPDRANSVFAGRATHDVLRGEPSVQDDGLWAHVADD